MSKYVDAEWLKNQIRIIEVTTGENFEKLINAAPSIEIDVNAMSAVTTGDGLIASGYSNGVIKNEDII